MEHTKGKLSLNNYHYPYAYLVIREGSDDNDAFPRRRKICDVTLDGKTEEEYKANAEELVRRWNAFEEGGIVDELLEVCEMVLRTKSLILPKGLVKAEHKDEVIALQKMYTKVEAITAKAK